MRNEVLKIPARPCGQHVSQSAYLLGWSYRKTPASLKASLFMVSFLVQDPSISEY